MLNYDLFFNLSTFDILQKYKDLLFLQNIIKLSKYH